MDARPGHDGRGGNHEGGTKHRTVLSSSLIGTTIEWYDFFLYSTAASIVFGELFFSAGDGAVGTLASFATFFVGFLARPIGAIMFGHIGDRLGRKRTLVTTMLLMGIATALIGVLPTYDQAGVLAPALLVLLRVLQGLAIGGEWAGAVLLAVEYAPRGRKGFYGSWPQAGLGIGLALGTGLFALLGEVMDDDAFMTYGWRIAFGVSIVLVVVGLVIRLKVEETPAFSAVKQRSRLPVAALVRHRLSRRHLALGMLARWGDGVAFNTWAVFAIAYCTGLGMSRTSVLLGVTVAAVVMAVLIPFVGRGVDRLGARRTYITGMVLFGLSAVPAFLGFRTADPWVVGAVLVVTLGIAYAISYSPEGTLFAQLFPTETRYTGMSVVYQFSGIYASGLTPMLITALFALGGGSLWWVCGYLVFTAVVSTIATLAIRPRDLYLADDTEQQRDREPSRVD
ncbi:MFS transporter [Saccharomonospora sp. CUA-673]|nr:MFS transporter [Saccharomonospora sp. CUA-673]